LEKQQLIFTFRWMQNFRFS